MLAVLRSALPRYLLVFAFFLLGSCSSSQRLVGSQGSQRAITIYLLEGTSSSNSATFAECLGQLNQAVSLVQFQELLANGGSVISEGGDSSFEITGKLEAGIYTCYTKLFVVKDPKDYLHNFIKSNHAALQESIEQRKDSENLRRSIQLEAERVQRQQLDKELTDAY